MIDFSQLNEFYVGGNEVQELYVNGNKVWQKPPEYAGLRFAAKQANSTVKIHASSSDAPTLDLEYSTDGGQTYSTYTVDDTITLANVGDNVWLRAGSNGNTTFGSNSAYNQFVITGEVACRGNILFLLNQSGTEPQGGLPSRCFLALFANCSSLVTAPELPATTLGLNCYRNMFYGCSSLVTAPELPATTLNGSCYQGMFSGCSSLNEIKLAYTGSFDSTYFNSWVSGVQTTSGTFYYNGSDTTRGTSAIPENWTITTFST